ncbi:hypothetical protein AGMMS50239_00130 [Bacteroidia bacterium]|nr:hypothetical protein AGMMS50239_00130 [Bacteroidia bacterium]
MAKITVQNTEITVISVGSEDYICITDMIKAKDGDFFVTDWLRNRNTLEYIGIWEQVYNPCFNYGEFAIIKNKAGLNSFKISVKEFVARTNAVGLQAKAGRYGGTFAHKDIAFEFAMWISPEFKIYIVKEFQRLKAAEANPMLGEWNVKRVLSKVNYTIHTDAVRDFVIPKMDVEREKLYAYADEADLLNLALWQCTAKQWREANPGHAKKGMNIRDAASINELVVLANLESFNAELLKRNVDKAKRYAYLHEMAGSQLSRLNSIEAEKVFRKLGTSAGNKGLKPASGTEE